MKQGLEPVEAARQTVARLDGAYALCFLFGGHEDLLVAARKGSPLAIGHGEGEMFVGSDALALAAMTNKVTYLEEGDFAVLSRTSLEITDAAGSLMNREMREISHEVTSADKGPFKHYMAKEIAEQPNVLAEAVKHYTHPNGKEILLPAVDLDFTKIEKLTMVACGTAYLACHVAKYWFEQIARLPVELDIASEFRYREPPLSHNSFAFFVSQSGETADTLAALRYCSQTVNKTVAIVNAPESSISREADVSLPILAGVEIGVASTKAFTAQVTVLTLMALALAKKKGTISDSKFRAILSELEAIPGKVEEILEKNDIIKGIAHQYKDARNALYLGRGSSFPVALEGALKLKEISYIHAEGYPAAEMKHGPIALIDENMPLFVIATSKGHYEKVVSNIQEIKSRSGKIIAIVTEGDVQVKEIADHVIEIPETEEALTPLLTTIPLQLLSYYIAVMLEKNVDQPRNLAKSVTVE